MRWLTPLGGLAVGILSAGVLAAAEPCFCLGDADDTVWYDCRTFHVGIDPNPQFECRPAPQEERVTVIMGHVLQRHEAGEKPCIPCKVEPQPIGNQIRGEDSRKLDAKKVEPLMRPRGSGVNRTTPKSEAGVQYD